MKKFSLDPNVIDATTRKFYRDCLVLLKDREVPYLVGGALAMAAYTGIVRHSKDLDLFLPPARLDEALAVAKEAGFATKVESPVWLAKICSGSAFVDLIFRSGNSLSEVTEQWFAHSATMELLGVPVRVCAPEETLLTKAFIMERERYDGADVAHYLLAMGHRLDWRRLRDNFGPHWRVLLSHLILFGFIYPQHRRLVPDWLMDELLEHLAEERKQGDLATAVCQGTFLSKFFYLVDVKRWGYRDARLLPHGNLTPEVLEQWREQLERELPEQLEASGISLAETSDRPAA